MSDKFTMELVWHNCLTCPPKEDYNDMLLVTDGDVLYRAKYDFIYGWFRLDTWEYIRNEGLHKIWWADISQTVRKYSFGEGCVEYNR